ncbi:MAG: putative Ig domain-containing protein, partial [Thermoplasmata archaeon]
MAADAEPTSAQPGPIASNNGFASVGANAPVAFVPTTLTNIQTTSTPLDFQDLITISPNTLGSSHFSSTLSNANWQDSNGNILPSWLESGNSNTATATAYWVNLTSDVVAASGGTLTIYLVLYATSVNAFNKINTGEAPQLSPAYAQYDDGPNVFPAYFNGNTSTYDFSVLVGGTSSIVLTNRTPVTYSYDGHNETINAIVISGYNNSQTAFADFVFEQPLANVGMVVESSYSNQYAPRGNNGTGCPPQSASCPPGTDTGVASLVDTSGANTVANGISVNSGYGGSYFSLTYRLSGTSYIDQDPVGSGVASWSYGNLSYPGPSGTSWSGTISPNLYSSAGGVTNSENINPLSTVSGSVYVAGLATQDNQYPLLDYINWERARYYPPNGVMPGATVGSVTTSVVAATPSKGPVGTQVSLSGAGFSSGTNYYCFESSSSTKCSAGAATFTGSTIPSNTYLTVPSSGNAYVIVSTASAVEAFVAFTVKTATLTLTPNTGPPGALVTFSGTGYAYDSGYTYYYCFEASPGTSGCPGGSSTLTVTSGGAISGSPSLALPSSNNAYGVVSDYETSTYTSDASFTEAAGIVLSPSSGPSGTSVTLAGGGFAGGTTYLYCVASRAPTVGSRTGNCGRSGPDFTTTSGGDVPTSPASTITVTSADPYVVVSISSSHSRDRYVEAVTEFTNTTATLTLNPAFGPTGTTTTLTGINYAWASSPGYAYDICFASSAGTVGSTFSPSSCSGTGSAKGSFDSTTGSIPASTTLTFPGSSDPHVIVYDASTDYEVANATFTLGASLALTPSSGPSGTQVTLSGSAYSDSHEYYYCVAASAPTVGSATGSCGHSGSIHFTTTGAGAIPTSPLPTIAVTSADPYVVVSDGSSPYHVTAVSLFTITTPTLTLTPSEGASGTQVTLSATSRLAADSNYEYYYCVAATAPTVGGTSGACSSTDHFLATSSGGITGSPTISVTSSDLYVVVSDSYTNVVVAVSTFTIFAAGTPSASPNPVDANALTVISTTAPTGGTGIGLTYRWSGSAPTGCALPGGTTTTLWECTPTAAGSYTTNVTYGDSTGNTVTNSFTLLVDSALVAGTPTGSPNPVDIGFAGGATISTTAPTGGTQTRYAYTWSGSVPTGCTLPGGNTTTSWACAPTAVGSGSYTITVTYGDSSGNTVANSFTLHVDPALVAPGTPTASVNPVDVGQQTVLTATAATGGSGTYTYSWSGLPAGCTSSNTLTLDCTPTAVGSGTYTITVTATDANGQVKTSSALTLTVDPALVAPGTPTASVNPVDVSQQTVLTATAATGGQGPYTYAWSGLPTGCTTSNTLTLDCTPTSNAASPYTITVTATDANGQVKTSTTLTLTVDSALVAPGTPSGTPNPVDVSQQTVLTAAAATGGRSPYT